MSKQTAGAGARRIAPTADWFSEYGIRHIAIIPDGNRRWAKEHKFPIELGHASGLLKVLPRLVSQLCDAGVHTITVWGFSTENWTRERSEVSHLMKIMTEFLKHHMLDLAGRHDARVCHLGRKDRLYPEVREALNAVELATAENRSHVYNVAVDYGGQDELARAYRRMAAATAEGRSTSDSLLDFLDTAGQPYPRPDVLVRASGERRLSGFLPLQTAYSELFFVKENFPEFTFEMLQGVAEEFKSRTRRFGS